MNVGALPLEEVSKKANSDTNVDAVSTEDTKNAISENVE